MGWSFNSNEPIYLQIVKEIIARIVNGILVPGQRLQSTRDLAVDAGVNLNTAQRAYSELEKRQVLMTKRGKGRFVVDDSELLNRLKKEIVDKEVSVFAERVKSLGISFENVSEILKKHMTEVE
ncbi:GntR family transcriptional regulator [Wukongibacter baidiensis]|uniref:GntR family transcriptional regulator n=1 Tax=Wukongibacter baidiensis TaxID=1723361 RepID=UPI003D7FEE4A